MCPPLIAALIPAIAGVAAAGIGAAGSAAGRPPTPPTPPTGGATPEQLAQMGALFGGTGGASGAGAAFGGAQQARGRTQRVPVPPTTEQLRTLDGRRVADEVPFRAPHSGVLEQIHQERNQRPQREHSAQVGRSIVRRVSADAEPRLQAIQRSLAHRATQIEATAEHRTIERRQAFERRITSELAAIRRDVHSLTRGWRRY